MTVPTFQNKPLLATGTLSFCAGSLYGWSALIPALERTFDTTTAQAGMVFSLSILAFTIAVYATPRMGKLAHDIRNGAIFAIVAAIALSLAAVSTSFLMFLSAFSAGFGFCSGAIYIIVLNCASRSIEPRFATAVTVAVFGLGAAVFGPVIRLASDGDTGLNVLLIVAVCFVICAGFTFISARGAPCHPDPVNKSIAVDTDPHNKTELIVLLWLVFCMGSAAGLMILGLAVSIVENHGASVWLSGITLFGVAIGNTAGRLSVGFIDKNIGASLIVIVALFVVAIGLLLCGLTSSILFISTGLTVIAAGYGMIASGIPTLTQSIFGPTRFHRIFSLVFSAWGVAGLTTPWIGGWLFDIWGSYFPAFVGAFCMTTIAILLAIVLHIKCTEDPTVTH